MPPLILALLAATPDPALIDVTGRELMDEVRQSKAPLVLVNAWATWCEPCVEELPALVALPEKYAGKVRVMLVSTDFSRDKARAAGLLKELGAPLPSWFKAEKDQPFIEALHPEWNGALPATFLFDRSGRCLAMVQGKLTADQLKTLIQKHL